jgi:hypothetical protein
MHALSNLLGLSLFVAICAVAAEPAPPVRLHEKHRTWLREHCVSCHNAEKRKGNLRLDTIDLSIDTVARAETWQKILNAVNAGEMPPETEKQPTSATKANFLEALAHTLVDARRVLSDSGGQSTIRRLNRREYANTIRDLLGVFIDVSDLPPDSGSGTFDTVGSSLFLSSDQLERYLALGRRAVDDAFALHSVRPQSLKLHSETEKVAEAQLKGAVDFLTKKIAPYHAWTAAVDAAAKQFENHEFAEAIQAQPEVLKDPRRFYRQWSELINAPSPTEFGFKDAAEGEGVKQQFDEETDHVRQYFQLPHVDKGSYLFVFIVRPQEQLVAPKDWPPGRYRLRIRIAALPDVPRERHFIEVGHPSQPGAFDLFSAHQITGTMEDPQTLDIPVTLTSTGSRKFAVREKRQNSREQEVALAVLYKRKHKTWYPPAMWIDWMELEGPLEPDTAPDVFRDLPPQALLEDFATRAFRGKKPAPEFIDNLTHHYERQRANGASHPDALKEALSVILASPNFLYLAEPHPNGQRSPLTPNELASRLSYFLWSAPPDAPLLNASLSNPESIEAELSRMILDPRIQAFVTGFTHQWLGLDRLNFFQFNTRLFPEFDDSLKSAARAEVYETFGHLLKTKGSLTQLLKSDSVTVNGLLAGFYGIQGVSGDLWQTVSVPAHLHRGGLLGMSAILAMGGNGERTSPVERGAWVLRKLLHDPPPPAPPNVPQLSRLADKPLSPRERVMAHQEEPQCASCHRKIDPIGFGLENFDAIGRWRDTETYTKHPGGRKAWPIETAGAFHNGPSFRNFEELRSVVETKSTAFARSFAEALIEYALGRPYSFIDATLADEMVASAARENFAIQAFIQTLCKSEAFRDR